MRGGELVGVALRGSFGIAMRGGEQVRVALCGSFGGAFGGGEHVRVALGGIFGVAMGGGELRGVALVDLGLLVGVAHRECFARGGVLVLPAGKLALVRRGEAIERVCMGHLGGGRVRPAACASAAPSAARNCSISTSSSRRIAA